MIVAFSGAAGSGKSTAAKALRPISWKDAQNADALLSKDMFVHLPFAGILKEMLGCMDPDLLRPENKEKPHASLCGKTPRFAMKTLGTEWGRDTIGEDIWIMLWRLRVAQCPNVVVDDLRFPNEYAVLRELGATVVEVMRPGVERSGDHPSEAWKPPADIVLGNTDGVEQLHQKVRALLQC